MHTEAEISLAELTRLGIRCNRCQTYVIVDVRQPNIASPAYCPACHADLDGALRERIHAFIRLLGVLGGEKEFVLSFHVPKATV